MSRLKDEIFRIMYETPDVDAAVGRVLALMGSTFHAGFSYVMEGAEGDAAQGVVHTWNAAGDDSFTARLRDVRERWPTGREDDVEEDGIFVCPDPRGLPPASAAALEHCGVVSLLQCAVMENGRRVGCVGLADCRERREDWGCDAEQREILRYVSKMLTVFVLKARRLERLERSGRRLTASLKSTEEKADTANRILDSIAVGVVVLKMPSYDKLLPLYGNIGQYSMLRIARTAENAAVSDDAEAELESGYFKDAFFGVHPDDMERVRGEFKAGYVSEHFTVKKYRLLRGDGKYVWVNADLRLRESTPEYKLFYATYTDVTEEQELQLQLAEALRTEKNITRELEKAGRAKTDFLARMSHDIRTPMNAIMGLAALAKKELRHPDAVKRYLDKLEVSGAFLLGLLNDILDIAKIEKNSLELHPEPYDIEEFRRQVETLIFPLCRKKNITFVFDASAMRHRWVLLDKLRFNQMLFNLLTNAVKYTPENGNVALHIQDLEEKEGRLRKRFIVRDNGIGMSEAFQKRMYEPFSWEEQGQRISNERSSGLGLSIVKSLVERMGGVVSVVSELGRGTAFTIDLEVEIAADPTERERREGAAPEVSLQGIRVLLCEDNALNREIAVYLLEDAGAVVDCAENGKAGVDKFSASEIGGYDVVLMDIRMPVLDGNEAARAIRLLDRPDAAAVPIIAVTANAYAEDREMSAGAGMNAHLSKPIDAAVLYKTILHHVGKR